MDIVLIDNLAIILSLSVLFAILSKYFGKDSVLGKVAYGILFGSITIIGMLNPYTFTDGIIFDGRSVILSVAAFFCGPVTALISVAIAGAYRIIIGGPGEIMGLLVIIESALTGLAFYYVSQRDQIKITVWRIAQMGLIVHILMLLLAFTLPENYGPKVLLKMTPTVLLLFTGSTVILGAMLLDQQKKNNSLNNLMESEKRFRNLYESMTQGVIIQDKSGKIIAANPAARRILGLILKQIPGKTYFHTNWKSIHEDGSEFPLETQPWLLALKTGMEVNKVVMGVFNESDNEYRWIRIDAIPQFRKTEMKPYQIFAIFEDITKIKLAELQLKKSEEKYKRIVETANEGVWVIDKENKTTFVNNEMAKMLGYSPDEMMGRSLFYFVDDEWKIIAKKKVEERTQGIEDRHEFKFLKKDGSDVWTFVSTNPMFDEKGGYQGALAMAMDISANRQAELELKRQSELVRVMTENQPAGIMAVDGSGKLLMFNKAAKDWYGVDIMNTSSEKWSTYFNLYRADTKIPLEEDEFPLNKAFRGERIKNYEVMIRAKNRPERIISCNGASFSMEDDKQPGAVIVMNDITDLKEKQRELEMKNTYIQTILDNLPLGVAINKIEEGSVTYINEKFQKIYGWPAAEINNVEEFFLKVYPDPDYRKKIIQRVMTDIQSGDPNRMHWEGIEITTAKGEKKIVNAQNIPLPEQDLMISTVQDVTRLEELIVKLKKSESVARKALVDVERRENLLNETGLLSKVGGMDMDLSTMTAYYTDETYRIYEIPKNSQPRLEDRIKYFAPEAQPLVRKSMNDAIKKHKPFDIQAPLITAKGKRIWVRAIGRVQVKNGKAVRFYGALQDITEQKNIHQELENSKEQFKSITDNLPGAVIRYKLKPDGTDRLTYVSEGASLIWGIKPEEAEKNNQLIWDQVDKRDIGKVKESIQISFKHLTQWNFEFRSHLPDHTMKWLQGIGIPKKQEDGSVLWNTIILDITARKFTEEKLKDRDVRLRTIFDNAPLVIFTLDRDAKFTYTNWLGSISIGIKAENLIGRSAFDIYENLPIILDEDKVITGGEAIRKVLQGEKVIGITHYDGSYFENQFVALKDDESNILGFLGISQDITQRIMREKEIANYQKSLRDLTTEITLVEEKNRKEIAANIHDHLSQPLVVSRMKLSDLSKHIHDREMELEIGSVIRHISDALEKSRKITYELCPPILYELGLIETIYWLADKIREEFNIKVDFKTDFDEISLPESRLILIFRVIQELVNNAVKHASAKSINISFNKKEHGLEIIIIDDGKGFDREIVNKPGHSNSGFGLFAVRERIQNLNGRFSINSVINSGTEVKIFVPLGS